MRHVLRLAASTAAVVGLCGAAAAFAEPYVALRGSIDFVESARTTVLVSGVDVPMRESFNMDWGGSVAVGNDLPHMGLSFELEGVYRSLKPSTLYVSGNGVPVIGSSAVVAPMFNAFVDIPSLLDSSVRPFLGAGLGGVYASIFPEAAGVSFVHDSAWGFGYQAMAGIEVLLTDHFTFSVMYRYLAGPSLRFHDANDNAYKSGIAIHSIDMGITYRI